MRYLYLLVACLLFAGCSKSDDQDGPIEPSKPSWTFMYLAGDSTCAPQSESDRPKYGWGEKLRPYLNKCSVDNKAVGGKSSKTYISDGYWSKLTQCLKEGDVVLIQFGHNDESTNSSDNRGTTPDEYYNYLLKMIKDVKAKKAMPVVLTPICRHQFSNGVPVYTHKTYPQKAKEVAAAESVILLDIEQLTYDWLAELGEEEAKLRFMMSQPGSNDTTHLTELGADEIAAIVAKALKESGNEKLATLVK